MTHKAVHCESCRASLFLPAKWSFNQVEERVKLLGWRIENESLFCSAACVAKGGLKRIREPVWAHIRFTPDARQMFKVGAHDCLAGFASASLDPDYLKGWELGESLRAAANILKDRKGIEK